MWCNVAPARVGPPSENLVVGIVGCLHARLKSGLVGSTHDTAVGALRMVAVLILMIHNYFLLLFDE